ncbi:MAG: hypothetical protein Q7U53_06235 [Anaerolineaceae bacterium]|nr:hypothetical protein [Anaerolineaceae bacterium]
MANISLREYIRKIENQIENGEIDQAIAHSKHILKIYPKHIDSYRLLGKALLEKQKYGDASDIFQRVLSSVPDDFISQIGMSIIREDENNLDAAIWHMERAFEVQPSNKAVQDELRRLYTNRDGVAPPKIRLTRGALVRMYTRGELFNQAIAEIWAALSEDPNRVDLEVILARIYYLLGQKVEATETCSKLISKLPYCYEANKILTEILPGTTREEDEKIFRQRVIDLDPYFQFTDEKIQLTSEVSDTKIMVEYLEWDPMSTSYEQPDWIQSIGLAMDSKQSPGEDFVSWLEDPENLTSDSPKTKEELSDEPEKLEETISNIKEIVENNQEDIVDQITTESSRGEEITAIPDWIKDAGWEISSEADDNLQKGFNIPLPDSPKEDQNEEIKEIEDEIEPAELPAWIREIAPKEENLDDSDEEEFGLKNLEELFDNIESKDPISNLENTKAQWKNEFEDETKLPFDKFKDLSDQPILTLDDEKDLDWTDNDAIPSILDKVIEGETQTYDFDSIKNLTERDINDQVPDLVEQGESEEYLDPDKDKLSIDQIISDLENGQEESKDQEAEVDDAWLSSLLVDQEKDGEIVGFGGLDEIKEEIPDWIKSVINNDDQQTPFSSEKLDENLPDWLSSSIEDSDQDMDDIKITFDESDDHPVEVNYDQEISEELRSGVKEKGIDEAIEEVRDVVSVDSDEIEEKLAEETLSSLENLILSEKKVEETEEIALSMESTQFEIGDVSDELEEIQPTSKSETSDLDSALAWMEGLAAKQGAEEATLISKPEDRFESPPDWISEETQLSEEISDDFDSTPSWLKELEIETSDVVIEGEKEIIDELSLDEDEVFLDETKENDLEFESEIKAEEPEENLYQTPELEDLIDVKEKIKLPDQISEIEEPVNELEIDELENEIPELTQPEETIVPLEPELLEEKSDFVELQTVDDFIDDLPIESDSILEIETSSQVIKSGFIDESSQNIETVDEIIPVIDEPGNLEKIDEAKKLLYSGDLDRSIDIYNSFIKDGLYLENIILDIQTALNHQYPIDINLWQALGDAFLKDNQLQNALDAYSKAEDLLS